MKWTIMLLVALLFAPATVAEHDAGVQADTTGDTYSACVTVGVAPPEASVNIGACKAVVDAAVADISQNS